MIPSKSLKKKVEYIRREWGLDKLSVNDFDYTQRIDTGKQAISMQQWYNFMLYERVGQLKRNVMMQILNLTYKNCK